MPSRNDTHYETLGLARDAGPADIRRAHERLTEEFRQDTTPPDPGREARIREAFAVLSDPGRRDEYDRMLEASRAGARRLPRGAAIAMGAVLALGGGVAWWVLAPSGSSTRGRPLPQIQAEVTASIGRLRSVDLAGNARTLGIAFTVAEGVMATACTGIDPRAQLVVTMGRREIPARVALADEALGICRLAVRGAGSWPIPLAGTVPPAQSRVLAAGLDAAGEVVLSEGRVLAVQGGPTGTVDASVPIGPEIAGRPLLDGNGRAIAIALAPAAGGVRHRLVPASWAESAPAASETSPPAAAAPAGEKDPHADPRAARTQDP